MLRAHSANPQSICGSNSVPSCVRPSIDGAFSKLDSMIRLTGGCAVCRKLSEDSRTGNGTSAS